MDVVTTNHEITHRGRGVWRALIVALGLAALGAAACSSGSSTGTNSPTSVSGPTSTPSPTSNPSATTTSPSSATTTAALASAFGRAYEAESGALATYRNVVSTLGDVGPFSNNVSAEQQHVSALTTISSRYAISPPAAGAGQPSPSTLTAACQLGVTIEQNIISTYNDELPNVSAYPDVTAEFQNLLSAARDNQLTAFQRCA